MNFSPDNFEDVRQLFHELCELSPELRQDRLRSLEETDALLGAEVRSLLECADVDCPAIDEAPSSILNLLNDYSDEHRLAFADAAMADDEAPARIGPYHICERLGQGGMGVVHRAEQTEPIRREVALKLVRAGMATRAMLARFEAERQTLASMNHAGIAKVYDAGVTDDGRPYFVMEYVPGEPLAQFCDVQRLSVEDRITLFIAVCDAVNHAHRRGVIHRDLKPSNVLVEMENGVSTPHVIDFGIAKALTATVNDPMTETAPGLLLGAPLYMSPEQAAHEHVVDTRSDVYSLGVMLHELLCGRTPIDPAELRTKSSGAVAEHVRKQEASAPSRCFASMPEEDRIRIAAERGCTPRALQSALRGELDWITMKALSREPGGRYESPSDLAADLQRRARREPVEAGPPTMRYRAGRFVARYRVACIAAAIVFLVLMTGVGGVLWQSRQTKIEMRNTAQVNQFLHKVLSSNSPWRTGGAALTLRAVLDEAAKDLELNDKLTTLTRARLHNTIGATYWGLSAYDEALIHFNQSLSLFISTVGEANSETIGVMSNMCHLLHRMGRDEESEAIGRRGLDLADRHLPPNAEVTGNIITNFGALLEDLGRDEEAEALLWRSVEVRRNQHSPEDLAQSLSNLGSYLMNKNQIDAAREYLEESVTIGVEKLGQDHPVTMFAQMNYSILQMRTNELSEALVLLENVMDRCRRVYGPRNFETISYSRKLIVLYAAMQRLGDSESLALESLEVSRTEFGPAHPMTIDLTEHYVAAVGMQGRIDESFEIARPLYEEFNEALGPDHMATRRIARLIGEIYDTIGDKENTDHWRAIAAGSPGSKPLSPIGDDS